MSLSLITIPTPAGCTRLEYKHSNGQHVHVGDIQVERDGKGGFTFRFVKAPDLGEPQHPVFRTRPAAAQYDALAWAEENVVVLIAAANAQQVAKD